jgi:hypothetical protein
MHIGLLSIVVFFGFIAAVNAQKPSPPTAGAIIRNNRGTKRAVTTIQRGGLAAHRSAGQGIIVASGCG